MYCVPGRCGHDGGVAHGRRPVRIVEALGPQVRHEASPRPSQRRPPCWSSKLTLPCRAANGRGGAWCRSRVRAAAASAATCANPQRLADRAYGQAGHHLDPPCAVQRPCCVQTQAFRSVRASDLSSPPPAGSPCPAAYPLAEHTLDRSSSVCCALPVLKALLRSPPASRTASNTRLSFGPVAVRPTRPSPAQPSPPTRPRPPRTPSGPSPPPNHALRPLPARTARPLFSALRHRPSVLPAAASSLAPPRPQWPPAPLPTSFEGTVSSRCFCLRPALGAAVWEHGIGNAVYRR